MQPILILSLLFLITGTVSAQTVWPRIEAYRNDKLGTQLERRQGIMDGNLVRTIMYNNTEIAHWPLSPSGEWPKGTGINYVDGICMLVVAEAVAPNKTAPNNLIHPVETFYREEMDAPLGVPAWLAEEPWGWTPVPGYMNPGSGDPAMSTQPSTWPSTWPSVLDNVNETFNGQWYGYFGRNIFNAQLETFFVNDDSKDAEWTRPGTGYYPLVKNSPRSPMSIYEGYKIATTDTIRYPGGFKPDEGKQWYNPDIRKGLGLRVETRGFQWSHILAEDIMFWHYDIINLSDTDYEKTYFGFYTDTGLGGEPDNGDDWASYDVDLDLTYGFDRDGKVSGRPDLKLGMYGYAYLESPGNSSDGQNNDNDTDLNGVPMIDERRDDGIDNDGDWKSYIDENGNGKWDWDPATQIGEALLNDVGSDGAGPFDEPWLEDSLKFAYHQPDADGTQGNGRPDPGEPNFDRTDKDESDQIGLTAVAIEKLDGKTPQDLWPKNDEVIWNRMSSARFDTSVQNSNIQIVFSSGPFLLRSGIHPVTFGRERFSMALLFAKDYRDLVFNKKTVQFIYNNDYKFTQPPLVPRLTAVPGDGKVFLFWDSRAEESTDPVLGYENNDPKQGPKKDFEGYMILRSTDPQFNSTKLITDAAGTPAYDKPIAQFDLVNGIVGPDPASTIVNGASFYRGDDTGLKHSYVDTDVINNQTYYYAVVSYDQGLYVDSVDMKIPPTACNKEIRVNNVGAVQSVSINCAIITPVAPAAGYIPPKSEIISQDVSGSGEINLNILNPNQVIDQATYRLTFHSTNSLPDGKNASHQTTGASLSRIVDGVEKSLGMVMKADQISYPGKPAGSTPFDGMVLEALNDTARTILFDQCNWISGNTTNLPTLTVQSVPTATIAGPKYTGKYGYFSSDYRIEFSDQIQDTSIVFDVAKKFKNIPVKFKVFNVNTGKQVDVITELADMTATEFKVGDRIFVVEYTNNKKVLANERWTCIIAYGLPGEESKPAPTTGDQFVVKIRKPFFEGDKFEFRVDGATSKSDLAKGEMKKIKVVPNPYIAASIYEPRNITENIQSRGERRIFFTHLPAKCTIRIYTVAGVLVKTLEKDSPSADGTLTWNLTSEDDLDVAYGMYIYHVDAPGIGEHIGKFALIK